MDFDNIEVKFDNLLRSNLGQRLAEVLYDILADRLRHDLHNELGRTLGDKFYGQLKQPLWTILITRDSEL
jgi:hypothetical protein